MTSQPLDDGIRRLLEFFFQLLDRNGKILLVLFAALTAMDDEADDEQEDGAEYDERAEDFSNGNDDRTPPLSDVLETDVKMHAAARIGGKPLQKLDSLIFTAVSAAPPVTAAPLTPLALRVVLDTRVCARLFLGAYLLSGKLCVLLLPDGLKALLDVDLILHVALDIPCLVGLREHHLHTDRSDIHSGTCLS